MSPKAQFNLLPDIKQKSVKVDRTRKTLTSAAVMITLISVGVFTLMLITVYGIQKKQLSDADGDLNKYSQQLKSTPDLEKILTVQKQLKTLADLHQKKHATSRIFNWLPEITPSNINLGNLSIDLDTNTLQIDGTANSNNTAESQKIVNTFIDTMKFTTYTVGDDKNGKSAFPSVVLTNFGVGDTKATFSISATFDPTLFSESLTDGSGNPTALRLVVPKTTTTHNSANGLFNGEGTSSQ